MKIVVIGGGPAGMMAAVMAARNGNEVTLIEKNEKLGKKLFITGKGRCNVTNDCDEETLFNNVISNEKFLYSAFYGFNSQMTMAFMEENGCKLKTERGNRVFPVSDHSSDVIKAMENALKNAKVSVLLNTKAIRINTEEYFDHDNSAKEKCIISGVEIEKQGKKEVLNAEAVVVATGGASYELTGSTGDGYRFATELGHTVNELRPALVPFETKEDWPKELMGLALKNVVLTLLDDKGKKLYSDMGEMLFTHFGISGPLVLSASSYYAKKKLESAQCFIDLKPALTQEQLDKRLIREFEEKNTKQFKNALGNLFPNRLIPVVIELSGISPEKRICDITGEERRNFGALIKKLPLEITGTRGFKEAIITQGGVKVKEINPSTMESKLVKNLYFIGEVLDLDALTGGFNLQIAWATGFLCGQSV